jgi:hypothetical protein
VVKDLELFRDRTASFRQVQICQQGQLLPVRRLKLVFKIFKSRKKKNILKKTKKKEKLNFEIKDEN